jgi:hypothetical protein
VYGALLLGLACLLLSAGVAVALTGTFKGRTSQHLGVSIDVVGNRVIQKTSLIGWKERCYAPRGHHYYGLFYGSSDFGGRLRHSRLRLHGSYRSYPGGPSYAQNVGTLQLRIRGRTARGTFTITSRVYATVTGKPRLSERCRSGRIKFSARR